MAGGVRTGAPRGRTATAPAARFTAASRRRARRAGVLGAVPVLAVLLAGCAVETVEGEIADQQLCVAAQPVVEAVRARGAAPGGTDDARDLAARAADPELQATLTDLGEAYADASGDEPDSAAWAEADRVVGPLDQVCQRLSAF